MFKHCAATRPLTAVSTRTTVTTIVARRTYFYTKFGEIVSRPKPLLTEKRYHPVLGIYESEHVKEETRPVDKIARKFAHQQHVDLTAGVKPGPGKGGRTLIHALRAHHQRLRERGDMHVGKDGANAVADGAAATTTKSASVAGSSFEHASRGDLLRSTSGHQLTLGQVVAVRRRLCTSKPLSETLIGVVIELTNRGWDSSLRLRTVIHKTGVEWKIPVYSPLVDDITILRRPARTPVGPNLYRTREGVDVLGKYINPLLLSNEKLRATLVKQLETGVWQRNQMALKEAVAAASAAAASAASAAGGSSGGSSANARRSPMAGSARNKRMDVVEV